MSKADLEASRLVFVYLAQSKPKRKVAIPVPDSYTWEQFLTQVKTRLRLTGVRDIYLASSGAKVRGVGELQDIDELCVVEAPTDEILGVVGISMQAGGEAPGGEIEPQDSLGGAASSSMRQAPARMSSLALERHRSSVPNGAGPSGPGPHGVDWEDDDKYARKAHPIKRTMQRLLPGLFRANSLPLTMREAESADGSGGKAPKRRRPRRSKFTAQNALAIMAIVSCFGTMVFFFTRVSQNAPNSMGGGPTTGPGDVADISNLPTGTPSRPAAHGKGVHEHAAATDAAAGGSGGGGGTGAEHGAGGKGLAGGAAAAVAEGAPSGHHAADKATAG